MSTGSVLPRVLLPIVIAGLLGAQGRAQGQDGSARPLVEAVRVEDPSGCFAPEPLAAQITTWTGRENVDPRLHIEVWGREDGMGYLLRAPGREVTRAFEHTPSDCPERRAAMGLAIALALDVTVLESLAPPEEDDATPEHRAERAVPEPPSTRTAVAEAPPPPREKPPWVIAAGVGVVAGVLPAPVASVQAGVALTAPSPARFELDLLATVEDEAPLGRGTVRTQLLGLRVGACLETRAMGPLGLDGCLAAGLGSVWARGEGFSMPRTSRSAWVTLWPTLRLRVDASPHLALTLSLDGLVELDPVELRVLDPEGRNLDTVSLPSLGGGFSIGLEWRP